MTKLSTLAVALLLSSTAAAQNCQLKSDVTPISAVQGKTAQSPLLSDSVTVAGVVTADWSQQGQLNGFFLQSLADHEDQDPSTSEALFVNTGHNADAVKVGTIVKISGTVNETNNLTQLTDTSRFYECGSSELPAVVSLNLPFSSQLQAETVEGMRVKVSGEQPLTISGQYQFARHGFFDLSAGRLWTPSQIAEPGAAAKAQAASNRLNRLQVDDNSNQRPQPLPYQDLFHGPNNSLRSGSTLQPITGILSQYGDNYRLQPTAELQLLQRSKITPIQPKRSDRLRIASFNVLNYFNGNGQGGGFPTDRGAKTLDQFKRQEDKIIAALKALDADVFGLMEIENDGFSDNSAIQQLVNALNQAQDIPYAIAQPRSERVGGDQISVAIIYNKNRLKPENHAQTHQQGPFQWGSRVPLAQVFTDRDSDQRFTAVVNHFKSKGGCPEDGANANQRDGQACWNALRLQSAEELVAWLNEEQLPNPVLIGDFNAYYMEDPMQYMTANGYHNVSSARDYSYVYNSQAGALDHILVSDSLTQKVALVQHINFNADEPTIYDYRDPHYYQPNPYRSSDHDPLLLDLDWRDSGK
ncbi:MAG: ExeM/NucH family extracellular endonuclease [Pseudomonadota bacterium]